jgi:hypothetical protein
MMLYGYFLGIPGADFFYNVGIQHACSLVVPITTMSQHLLSLTKNG